MANCNQPISTTCLIYQGKDLSFSSTLTNKKDFESIIQKIDLEIQKVKADLAYPIDPKGIVQSAGSIGGYVQLLIDEIGGLKKASVVENTPTIDISSLGGKTTASYDEALVLIMQQLAIIEGKLSNVTNIPYIPNV